MAILISHDFLYNVCLALSRCHSVSISLLSAYISLALSRLSPVSVALRLDLFPYHGTPSRFVDVVYVFPSLAVNLFISFILCPSLSHSLATHTLYRSLSVSLPISLSLSRFLRVSFSVSVSLSLSLSRYLSLSCTCRSRHVVIGLAVRGCTCASGKPVEPHAIVRTLLHMKFRTA